MLLDHFGSWLASIRARARSARRCGNDGKRGKKKKRGKSTGNENVGISPSVASDGGVMERLEWSRLPSAANLQLSRLVERTVRRGSLELEEADAFSHCLEKAPSSSTLPHQRTKIRTNPWFSSCRMPVKTRPPIPSRLIADDQLRHSVRYTDNTMNDQKLVDGLPLPLGAPNSSSGMFASISSGYGSHDSTPESSPESSVHNPNWGHVVLHSSPMEDSALELSPRDESEEDCDCATLRISGKRRSLRPPSFHPPPPPPLSALTAVSEASQALQEIDAQMAELENRAQRLSRSIHKARTAREQRVHQVMSSRSCSSQAMPHLWSENFQMAL